MHIFGHLSYLELWRRDTGLDLEVPEVPKFPLRSRKRSRPWSIRRSSVVSKPKSCWLNKEQLISESAESSLETMTVRIDERGAPQTDGESIPEPPTLTN